jgi:hypothetical protein
LRRTQKRHISSAIFNFALLDTLLYNAKWKFMDISQAVSISKFFVPLAASWMIFRSAKRIRARWLRLSIRTVSSVLVGISAVLVLLVSVASVGCSRYGAPIYSPDGRHLAVRTYVLQGVLGDDYATVGVRPRWRPWATGVYSGLGNWNFAEKKPGDPEVRWLNSAHLLIRYRDERTGNEGRGGPPKCLGQAGAVHIVCESVVPATSER